MTDTNRKKIVHRFPPCPSYDVEGIESWLNDMARDGYLLEKDGLWCGFMSFEKVAPQAARYTLQAAQKPSQFMEYDNAPSSEEQELCETYGWEFLTTYGQFYIYRSFDPHARPMNTDQEIHAISLNSVRKRERNTLITNIIFTFFWVFMMIRHPIWPRVAEIGTPISLLLLSLVLWAEISQIITFVRLHQLYVKIRDGGTLDCHKDWKQNAKRHKFEMVIYIILVLLVIILGFRGCYVAVMDENQIPISQFNKEPPFATIADFGPNGIYTLTDDGYSNTVREQTDLLFPQSFHWFERGEIKTEHGTISGSMIITYHETVAPWLAKQMAIAYHKDGQSSKFYHLMDLQELDVDYAVAYGSSPTVILQKGNIVVKAIIFISDESGNSMYQDWAKLMAEML